MRHAGRLVVLRGEVYFLYYDVKPGSCRHSFPPPPSRIFRAPRRWNTLIPLFIFCAHETCGCRGSTGSVMRGTCIGVPKQRLIWSDLARSSLKLPSIYIWRISLFNIKYTVKQARSMPCEDAPVLPSRRGRGVFIERYKRHWQDTPR